MLSITKSTRAEEYASARNPASQHAMDPSFVPAGSSESHVLPLSGLQMDGACDTARIATAKPPSSYEEYLRRTRGRHLQVRTEFHHVNPGAGYGGGFHPGNPRSIHM